MTTTNVTEQEVADLFASVAEAASAFINGDMRRYVELIKHGDDYTLMAPFGGETRRGFDDSDEALDATARTSRAVRRPLTWCSRTCPATWPCWWWWNGSTAGSAGCRTRTCRCG